MRRGRGEGGRDRAAHRLGVHRVGGEVPHRAPRGQHLAGAVAEHVLRRRPDQRLGAGAVVLGDQVPEPPDQRHRDAGHLALDQVGSRRQFVGDSGDRHLQRLPEGVGLAAVVAQRGQPRGADGRVRLAYPPGPSHRVGDHHRHVDVAPLAQPAADPARGVVRIRGQQGHRAGGRVGVVHPGRGEHQAMVGLHDAGRAAPRHHPDRLRVDRLVPVGPDDPVLRLAHDLRGDHQDVAVGQVRCGVRDQDGQVVAGRDLGEAGHAGHRQAARGGRAARDVAGHPRRSRARSRAARAMVAVAARLVMYRGSARTVIPARSGSSTAALSCSSTSQPFSRPGP